VQCICCIFRGVIRTATTLAVVLGFGHDPHERTYEGPLEVSDARVTTGEPARAAETEEPRIPSYRTGTESDGPPHQWVYRSLLAARVNPLGAAWDVITGYRFGFRFKPGKLFNDAHLGLKVQVTAAPGFVRGGPRIEFAPLAVFKLTAAYHYVRYRGLTGRLVAYPTPTAEFDDSSRREIVRDVGGLAASGHYLLLGGLLQARIKGFAVRNEVQAYYAALDLDDEQRVYYEQISDVMQPNRWWSLVNDLDALYLFRSGLTLALRYTVAHPFYTEEHFRLGEGQVQPNGPTHRLGPGLIYTLYDQKERRFNRPTVALLVQWWVRHRYRTGADVHPAIPCAVLAVWFEGTLLPDPRPLRKRHGSNKRMETM